MDLSPPSWAPNWCYAYLALAIARAVAVLAVVFFAFKKFDVLMGVATLLVGGVMLLDTMTFFWMCRASLAK